MTDCVHSMDSTNTVISKNINKDYEFSLFNDDEEDEAELQKLNNDEEIYKYLKDKYLTNNDKIEFYSHFFKDDDYKNPKPMRAKEFSTIGVYEDLSYYSLWMSDKNLENIINIFKNKYNIFYWRRVKGDGNCYYRAILLNYLELLIIHSVKDNNHKIFFNFIKEIFYTKFPDNKLKFKFKLITVLLFIYQNLNECSISFDILYRSFNFYDAIEKTLIFWFKLKLSDFLTHNPDFEINGLKLIQTIPNLDLDDNMKCNQLDLINYINNKLQKMDEYAEGYPIYITPYILKCNINIYSIINSNNANSIFIEKFEFLNDIRYTNVEQFLPDLKEENINLLFKSPHYNSLSDKMLVEYIKKYYNNIYLILQANVLNKDEYDEYKTSVVQFINDKKNNNKILQNNNSNNKPKHTKIYEEILLDSKKQVENNTINNNIDYSLKHSETNKICKLCNTDLNELLPCGCLVCNNCAKNKIKSNSPRTLISICPCGYILNKFDINKICK